MKIYTKTGDAGTTSLLGGTRVNKSDLRIEAYGTVDELNSFIGLLRSAASSHNDVLKQIQNILFNIGSLLATEKKVNYELPNLKESDIEFLESEMDNMESELDPLRNFTLPGGLESNALAHVSRSVCRRAERRVVDLEGDYTLIVKYLNRLSDYFFMLSRYLLHQEGISETIWEKD